MYMFEQTFTHIHIKQNPFCGSLATRKLVQFHEKVSARGVERPSLKKNFAGRQYDFQNHGYMTLQDSQGDQKPHIHSFNISNKKFIG